MAKFKGVRVWVPCGADRAGPGPGYGPPRRQRAVTTRRPVPAARPCVGVAAGGAALPRGTPIGRGERAEAAPEHGSVSARESFGEGWIFFFSPSAKKGGLVWVCFVCAALHLARSLAPSVSP